jgi:predicted esterase
MIGELTSAQTSDGLTLHGLLVRSERPANPKADVLIFVHGVGSNFYQSSLLRKTRSQFVDEGISLLSINTRGHDFLFSGGRTAAQPWLGSANELVDECRLDLAAWIQKAGKLGFERMVLFGHSLGAIKVIYSQAKQPHAGVQGVIAVSPSCLSCSHFLQGSRAEEFRKHLDWAKEKIELEQDQNLEQVSFPFPLMMTPRTFYDKYGPEEKYNILNFVEKVQSPLQLVFGELEVSGFNPAFDQLDQRVQPVIEDHSNISLSVIPHADHYYSGVQSELAGSMLEWLAQL